MKILLLLFSHASIRYQTCTAILHTLYSLELEYCLMRSYPRSPWRLVGSNEGAIRWAADDRITTLASGAEDVMSGRSSRVSRKWPRWFTWGGWDGRYVGACWVTKHCKSKLYVCSLWAGTNCLNSEETTQLRRKATREKGPTNEPQTRDLCSNAEFQPRKLRNRSCSFVPHRCLCL